MDHSPGAKLPRVGVAADRTEINPDKKFIAPAVHGAQHNPIGVLHLLQEGPVRQLHVQHRPAPQAQGPPPRQRRRPPKGGPQSTRRKDPVDAQRMHTDIELDQQPPASHRTRLHTHGTTHQGLLWKSEKFHQDEGILTTADHPREARPHEGRGRHLQLTIGQHAAIYLRKI